MANTAIATTATAPLPDKAEADTHLSRSAYSLMALGCLILGIWASWITWRFFVHGSEAMEADPAVREISVAAATMFIVCEMCAFGLAAMLPKQRLWAIRWQLFVFAGAMLVFECVTIILTQRGIITVGVLQAKAIDSRASQLEASITAQRAAATALREHGAKSTQSQYIGARDTGAASVRQSLAAEQRLAKQADTLAEVQAQRKPTTTELLGEDGALYYAVARGILVSVAGLVFFGAAGALVRAARNAQRTSAGVTASSAATQSAASTFEPEPAPMPAVPAAVVAPVAPVAPANVRYFPEHLYQDSPTPRSRTNAWAAGAAVPLAIAAAGVAAPGQAEAAPQHQAQSVSAPADASGARGVSTMTHPGVSTLTHRAASAATPEPASAPTSAPTDAPAATPKRAKKPALMRAVAPGVKVDTGVGERDGARYQRVRAGVLAGTIKPSLRGIQAAEGGSVPTVRGYLAQLQADGLITPKGRGYATTLQKQQQG